MICGYLNSTNLPSSLGHLGVRKATSIQTFDFFTMYTSIPHDLLKSPMNNIIKANSILRNDGEIRGMGGIGGMRGMGGMEGMGGMKFDLFLKLNC